MHCFPFPFFFKVNFTDKTEIILSSEHKLVTYVNKKGERSNYPLATALDSQNTEMAKRLKVDVADSLF
jgi:polo-like kinase 1